MIYCGDCGRPLNEGETCHCTAESTGAGTARGMGRASSCPRCGWPVAPGKRFCTRCGLDQTRPYRPPPPKEPAPAEDETPRMEIKPDEYIPLPDAEAAAAPSAQEQRPASPRKNKRSGDAGWIAAIAALVAVLGLGTVLALDIGGARGALGYLIPVLAPEVETPLDSGEPEEETPSSEAPAVSQTDTEPGGDGGEPAPNIELVYTTELAIEPQWADAGVFDEYGYARVKSGDYWGIIDWDGDYLVEPLYRSIGLFAEGFAVVDFDGRYGFLDLDGRMAIAPQYDYAGSFSEGLAVVFQDNLYGYINMQGELVIPCRYSAATAFSEGYAAVSDADGAYFIDPDGETVSGTYQAAGSFSEGRAAVRSDTRWGYVDENFELVIDYQYETAGAFVSDRAAVSDGERFFFIDRENAVSSTTADRLAAYSDEMAAALIDDRYGFVDLSGRLVIPTGYREVQSFASGLCPVSEDGEHWYYINKEGETVIDWEFQEASRFYSGLSRAMLDGHYGFVDLEGNLVESFQWDDAGHYFGGMIAVCKSGRWGYLRVTEQEAYF